MIRWVQVRKWGDLMKKMLFGMFIFVWCGDNTFAQEQFFAFCDTSTQIGRVYSRVFMTDERRSDRPFREFLHSKGYVPSTNDGTSCHYWNPGADREGVLRWAREHTGDGAIALNWPVATTTDYRPTVDEIEVDASLNGYFGGVTPERLYTFRSDREAEGAVDRIVAVTGLRRNFSVRASAVANAAAAIRNGERLLLYNPEFMEDVEQRTGNRWAGISVMAHEIGHHLQGHTITGRGSHPPIELEADEFSGFVLQRLGASLEDAQAVMRLISSEDGSRTHPAKRERLTAIASGWRAARIGGRDDAEREEEELRERERLRREREEEERREEIRERDRLLRERERERLRREREEEERRLRADRRRCERGGGRWDGYECRRPRGSVCYTPYGSCPIVINPPLVGEPCLCRYPGYGDVYGRAGR